MRNDRYGNNCLATNDNAQEILQAQEAEKHPEILRLEKKFDVNILSVIGKSNGKWILLCEDASTLETNISDEAAQSIEKVKCELVKDTSQIVCYDYGINIGYIVDLAKAKCLTCDTEDCRHIRAVKRQMKQEGESSHCAICGRELTDPDSIRLGIGPECRKKISTPNQKKEPGVTDEMREASHLYENLRHQRMIIKAILELKVPLPVRVIPQKIRSQTEYWGYINTPYLYYLDENDKCHVVYYAARHLQHRVVDWNSRKTSLDTLVLKTIEGEN